MKKARFYSTVGAILGGLVFAYVLVQVQYNDSFLLGDIMQLTLPENFAGVYYHVDTGSIEVSSSSMTIGTDTVVDISYNPERVSLNVGDITSSHTIQSVIEDDGLLSVSVHIDSQDKQLFSVPLVSDEEYHIVVSDASVGLGSSAEPLAIQRL